MACIQKDEIHIFEIVCIKVIKIKPTNKNIVNVNQLMIFIFIVFQGTNIKSIVKYQLIAISC